MDEIQSLAERLKVLIAEERAERGRTMSGWDDTFDVKVRSLCDHMLDAAYGISPKEPAKETANS